MEAWRQNLALAAFAFQVPREISGGLHGNCGDAVVLLISFDVDLVHPKLSAESAYRMPDHFIYFVDGEVVSKLNFGVHSSNYGLLTVQFLIPHPLP